MISRIPANCGKFRFEFRQIVENTRGEFRQIVETSRARFRQVRFYLRNLARRLYICHRLATVPAGKTQSHVFR